MVIGLGTLGAQLGHTWGTKLYFLGHTWGTVGAKSYLGHTWGTLGAETVGAQLGHSWGTLGAHLGQPDYQIAHIRVHARITDCY